MCSILLPGSVIRSGLLSFPFFTVIKILFLPVRLACMDASTGPWCGPTMQPSFDCPSPETMRGARAKPRDWFKFNVQKWPGPVFGGTSLPKKPHLDPKPDGCQSGRKSTGGTLSSTTDSRKKGSCYSWCVTVVKLQNYVDAPCLNVKDV